MSIEPNEQNLMKKHPNKMTVLCIPCTHAISHISRLLLLTKELRNKGYEIIFAGKGPKITFIQQEGFNVIPLYEPDLDILFGNIHKGKLEFVSNKVIEQMIEADLALYDEVKPDIVLTDGRFTAPISTHIAGLKHAAVVNSSSTVYRKSPYIPFFEWIPDILISRKTWVWKIFELLNLKIEMFIFDNSMNIFKKLSEKYNLKEKITATNCLTGKDITLLADIPEYIPTKNLPKNYHYIGPLALKTDIATPSWWLPKKRDKPLVCITMGTTGINTFFYKMYKLIQKSELMAIITTESQIDENEIETLNEKIHVEPFIDNDLVMGKCDLVICHGGNGTIYQALYHGKPVICISTLPDQEYNSRRVETLGVGKSLNWKKFHENPNILLDAISTIHENSSFTQKAQQMQTILKNYNGEKIGANIIAAAIEKEYLI